MKTGVLLKTINQSYFSNGSKMFYETHQILDICEEWTYKDVIKCCICKVLLFMILVYAPHKTSTVVHEGMPFKFGIKVDLIVHANWRKKIAFVALFNSLHLPRFVFCFWLSIYFHAHTTWLFMWETIDNYKTKKMNEKQSRCWLVKHAINISTSCGDVGSIWCLKIQIVDLI